MKALMLSGSRNPEGQTAQAVDAVLKGVAAAGGETERIFLPPLQIERCRQCDDNGWGPCRTAGRCVIQDDFLDLVAKIGEADVVIFATPVYYSDLSESLRVFTDRLRRVCTQESTRRAVKGKPAIAVCVAAEAARRSAASA
jgi:multimeric flavodoxin WrbA